MTQHRPERQSFTAELITFPYERNQEVADYGKVHHGRRSVDYLSDVHPPTKSITDEPLIEKQKPRTHESTPLSWTRMEIKAKCGTVANQAMSVGPRMFLYENVRSRWEEYNLAFRKEIHAT